MSEHVRDTALEGALYDPEEIEDFLYAEDEEGEEPEYEHIEWGIVNPTEETNILVVDVTYAWPTGVGQWLMSQVDLLYDDGWAPAWFCGEDGFEVRMLHAETSSATNWVFFRVEARTGWAGAQDKARIREYQRNIDNGMGIALIMHDRVNEETIIDYPGLLLGKDGFVAVLTEEQSRELSGWVYQFGHENMANRYYIPHRERA